MDRERKLKGQQALYQDYGSLRTMDKILHIHNQKDNISNPGMGQEPSPAQDDHKLAAQNSDASSPYSTTRRLDEKSNTENETTQRWRKCLLP
jgi:hypothetical protein